MGREQGVSTWLCEAIGRDHAGCISRPAAIGEGLRREYDVAIEVTMKSR